VRIDRKPLAGQLAISDDAVLTLDSNPFPDSIEHIENMTLRIAAPVEKKQVAGRGSLSSF
jgi:hypothetical protein